MQVLAHGKIYQAAGLYDLAFSYRDFQRECRFLRGVYERRRGRGPESFLELAAGPARHALEMQAAGVSSSALDLSPEMGRYAASKAAERGLTLEYLVADMTAFATHGRFDLAACMLCSATYLLTDQAFVSHLACVHAALSNDGLYVLEMPYTSTSEQGKSRSGSEWIMRDEYGVLAVQWIDDAAAREGSVGLARARLEYTPFDGSSPTVVTAASQQRDFSRNEIAARKS